MLSLILGFVTGLAGPISTIAGKITDLKTEQVKAKSNTEIKQIDQEIQEAEFRKSVLIAEAGHRISAAINATVRMALTIPPAIFLWKVLVHDKVMGSLAGCAGDVPIKGVDCYSYRTDALDSNLWWVIIAVVGFYFVYDIGSRLARK